MTGYQHMIGGAKLLGPVYMMNPEETTLMAPDSLKIQTLDKN